MTMLDQITPLILTHNEAANIARTLERLRWAREIVVVDSFSDDETLDIVSGFPNVRVIQRTFDSHAAQSNFGLSETGISTEWVLSLDADFVLTREFVAELSSLQPAAETRGFGAQLVYCVDGRELRSSLLPELVVLFRRGCAMYVQDGHAHRVHLEGAVGHLQSKILHDDRKPLSRWFEAQRRYMQLEAKKLRSSTQQLNFADRLRGLRIVAPFAVLFYCLIIRGGIFDGRRGLFYAFQRMAAELMLSLYLIEGDLKLSRLAEPAKTSEIKLGEAGKAH
jgi:glycosyltransferase involved in cell wall biosynthesis